MADPHIDTIERFFHAMQAGATAEEEMMALFAEDAVYLEPFSGRVREHRGRAAIRAVMNEGWKRPLPRMRIEIDSVSVAGPQVKARWTCYSPALPGGRGRGENLFTLRGAVIVRLETRLLQD